MAAFDPFADFEADGHSATMWIASILFLPFLIYGLSTGRMPCPGRGTGFRINYSRETQPVRYWSVGAGWLFLIVLGLVGTFYPRIANVADDVLVALLLLGAVSILAILFGSLFFQRVDD